MDLGGVPIFIDFFLLIVRKKLQRWQMRMKDAFFDKISQRGSLSEGSAQAHIGTLQKRRGPGFF